MKITIVCDQIQCMLNRCAVCTHHTPHITKQGKGYTCLSKSRKVVQQTEFDDIPENKDFIDFEKPEMG